MSQTRRPPKRFAPLDSQKGNVLGAPPLKGIVFDVDGTLWYVRLIDYGDTLAADIDEYEVASLAVPASSLLLSSHSLRLKRSPFSELEPSFIFLGELIGELIFLSSVPNRAFLSLLDETA